MSYSFLKHSSTPPPQRHSGGYKGAAPPRSCSGEGESALGAQAPLEACQAAPGPGRESGNFGGETVHMGNKLLQGKGIIFTTCPTLEQGLKGGVADWNISAGGASEDTDVGAEGRRESKVREQMGTNCTLKVLTSTHP